MSGRLLLREKIMMMRGKFVERSRKSKTGVKIEAIWKEDGINNHLPFMIFK
jgi:hypothetical protein